MIAPAQFAALARPIDEAAKKVKIIGIDSAADTTVLTSMLTTDNVQAGRIAADILAERIQKTTPMPKATWRSSPLYPGSPRSISVPRASRNKSRQNMGP